MHGSGSFRPSVPPFSMCLALFLAALFLMAGPVSAQSRLFPSIEPFEYPLASPRAATLAGRIISHSLGETQFGDEVEAEVVLGEDFPLYALRRGPDPLTLGFGVQTYARFSLDDPKSSLISNDWVVGFNLHQQLAAWDFTLQLYHESSHLGDEYAESFGVTRIDWSRAAFSAWAGWGRGPLTVRANLQRVVIDQMDLSPWGAAFAIDYAGNSTSILGAGVRPVAGLFVDGWSETEWTLSPSARLGVGFPGSGGRELRISFIAHSGLSTQRQFFREKSRYVGVELEFQL